MAEFRRLPTQQELQQMLFMQGLKPQTTAEIVAQNLQPQTVKPIPENVFQKMAGGARTAAEYVNRAGSAADVAKLFPGYTGQSQVSIPTGFNFAPKQDPMGGVIPQGMQTQQVNVGQLLQAIKPADVIGLTGAQQAYSDIGAGKAPNPMDVVDTLGLGAAGVAGTKGLLKATKGLPVGMSIQDVSGGLLKPQAPVSPIGFYSAVEQTALNIPRKQGTGQAFLNDIMKGENVKADEIKWMGLDDFLKGKQNVTKQEVQDYIANNRVDIQEVKSKIPRLPGEEMPGDEGAFLPKFGQYTLPGGENYRELLLTLPDNFGAKPNKDGYVPLSAIMDAQYQSSHFPNQPNILAHLRVNDRVDADGKKMLLIEEVQSDWHQAGRDKGYATGKEEKAYIDYLNDLELRVKDDAKSDFLSEGLSEDRAEILSSNLAKNLANDPRKLAEYFGETEKQMQLHQARINARNAVPDAPMKDTWYQLALKRAIQHAAENGYDRIGLTTGSRQAERFDLSKQLGGISYNTEFKRIAGFDKSGTPVVYESNVEPDQIANYIGKEAAKKLLSQPLTNKEYLLEGINLRVGGEGMKKYYDEIYPKFLDKYGKKWGARVGETSIKGTGTGFDYFKDGDMFSVVDVNNNVVGKFKTQQEAAKEADKMNSAGAEPIRYIDITPEMKASVSKGQPLFQAIPAIGAGGLLGAQEEPK